jgi:hypothetical protein
MADLGAFSVKVRFDMWTELLSILSNDGLSDLECAIALERNKRRPTMNREA